MTGWQSVGLVILAALMGFVLAAAGMAFLSSWARRREHDRALEALARARVEATRRPS